MVRKVPPLTRRATPSTKLFALLARTGSPASHEAGYALDEATRAGLTPESPASHEAGYAAWS